MKLTQSLLWLFAAIVFVNFAVSVPAYSHGAGRSNIETVVIENPPLGNYQVVGEISLKWRAKRTRSGYTKRQRRINPLSANYPSERNFLKKLRIQAKKLGANEIIDVKYISRYVSGYRVFDGTATAVIVDR